MLFFTFTCITTVLLVWPVAAQLHIDPDVIFDPANSVEIVLDQDNYTSVRVRQETNVKLDCSFVRSRLIQNRSIINPATSVSVRWFLKRENPDFMSLEDMTVQVLNMNPEQILIIGQFMDVLNVTAIQLPTLAVDGVTGEYTCMVCNNRGTPQEVCVDSTIRIEGEPFPPDIDEGDPDGTCPINPLFRFAMCKVGTNYCIPMNNVPSTYMFECVHKPPPAPTSPTPQQAIWFLNGVQITTNTGARNADTPSTVNVNSVNKQLTIINSGGNAVRGNYTCMLTNIAGSDVATSIISNCMPSLPVIQPGRVDSSAQIQIGLSQHCLTTSQLTITCKIQSRMSPVTFLWTKDGAVLCGQSVRSDRIVVTTPGIYSCTAINQIGTDSATTQVLAMDVDFAVQIVGINGSGCERLDPPPHNAHPNTYCVFTNEQVSFNCSTGSRLQGPRGQTPLNQSTITVTDADSGVYTCSSSSGCAESAFIRVFENGVWVADEWSQCESRRRVSCVGARSGQQLGEARCSGERPATVSTDQCSGNCQ